MRRPETARLTFLFAYPRILSIRSHVVLTQFFDRILGSVTALVKLMIAPMDGECCAPQLGLASKARTHA